jgi:hypothetical protein
MQDRKNHKNLKRDKRIKVFQEVGPLAYIPPKLTWRNASHRNCRGFGSIHSNIPKDSQEKIVQKSYEILIFFVHSKDSQVSVWLFYTAVVGKTFICKPTSIGRSHAKKSNICLPS